MADLGSVEISENQSILFLSFKWVKSKNLIEATSGGGDAGHISFDRYFAN